LKIASDVINLVTKAATEKRWKFRVPKMHFEYNKVRLLRIFTTSYGKGPDLEKQDTRLTMPIPRTEKKSFL